MVKLLASPDTRHRSRPLCGEQYSQDETNQHLETMPHLHTLHEANVFIEITENCLGIRQIFNLYIFRMNENFKMLVIIFNF